MLRKLLKYEIKATSRYFLLMYLTLFVFTLINRFLVAWSDSSVSNTAYYSVIMAICMLVYFILMAALSLLTVGIMIQRFYKNLLGEEGYLMFTLPVPTWKQIVSKLAVSILWTVVSIAVAFLSIITVFSRYIFTPLLQNEFSLAISLFHQTFGAFGYLTILEFIIMGLASLAAAILTVYGAIALGHLFSRYKTLASFGMYILIGMASQILLVLMVRMISLPTGLIDWFNTLAPIQQINVGLWVPTIFSAIIAVACFVLTNYILTCKLNLE